MSLKVLTNRIERLQLAIRNQDTPDVPIIQCYWGDALIPDKPGSIIIRTQWGRGTDPRKRGLDDEYRDVTQED